MEHKSKVIPKIQVLTLHAQDGQRVAVRHYQTGHDAVIVLAHGFFNNKDVYLFRQMAEKLSVYYDVLVFDFRGHGESGGFFGWTSHEQAEINRILLYVKEQGYQQIGLMGFSLGAAVSLVCASENRCVHSVIAVSAPFDFWEIDFHFWELEMFADLKLNMGFKGKGKGVLPGNPFMKKVRPIDIVDRISPTPVMFIHGEKDWLIKPRHSRKLFKQALAPKRMEMIADAGHAEKIFDSSPDDFLKLCLEWFGQTLH